MTRGGAPSKRADVLRIADMEHAAALLDDLRATGKDRFVSDRTLQDAAIRRFEVLGEAAGHVSKKTREAFPEIPWAQMRGFSSFAKHEYWRVDLDRVWETIEETPALRRSLGRVRLNQRHTE